MRVADCRNRTVIKYPLYYRIMVLLHYVLCFFIVNIYDEDVSNARTVIYKLRLYRLYFPPSPFWRPSKGSSVADEVHIIYSTIMVLTIPI